MLNIYSKNLIVNIEQNLHRSFFRKSGLPYAELIYLEEKHNLTHCNLPISLQNVVLTHLRDAVGNEIVINDTASHKQNKNIWKHCKYLFFANFDQVKTCICSNYKQCLIRVLDSSVEISSSIGGAFATQS